MSRKKYILAALFLSLQGATQTQVPVLQNPTASQSIVQPSGTSFSFSPSNEAGIVYAVGSYNWPAQMLNTALMGGVLSTVTLNPCPAGLVPPFTRIWIADNDLSKSEAVALSTTTSPCPLEGGGSGMIAFTPANNHTALQYKLESASQGIQEAINAANSVSSNFPNQLGKVIVPPGDYTAMARISILGSKQYIDANGAVLTCTMADTCVFVGDTGSANTTWDVTIDGFAVRPGYTPTGASRFSAIEDNGQHTTLRGIVTRDPSSAGPAFFSIIQIDDDQSAVIEKLDPSKSQGWAHCGTDWCSVAIYGPGSSLNPGVLWVKDSNISAQGAFNGIDNQDANTLRVSDSVVQGYAQFGIRSAGSNNNVAATLDNVYMEVGNATNPLGVGTAGLISEGFISVMHSTAPAGKLPQFGSTTSTLQLYAYYIVVHGTINSQPVVSAPYLVGWAYQTPPITVKWPQPPATNGGALTFDLLRQTVSNLGSGTAAPYGTGNFAVHPAITTGNCSSNICSYVDSGGATGNYTVTAPSTYAPALTFWPGSVILTEPTDSGTTNGGEPRLFTDIVGPSTGIGLGGFVNSYGANAPTVFAQQCSGLSTWSSIWVSCPAGDSISNNYPQVGAMLLQAGPVASDEPGGYKGRINLMAPHGTMAATHLITLADANPAKTLATPGHRPLLMVNPNDMSDVNDTWIGLDNLDANVNQFQLAFGAPVSISSYIGNIGDNTNYFERLQSNLKIFRVPITTNSAISSTLTSGPPFSVASSTPVANLTTVPTTYNHSGTQQINTHIVVDRVPLNSGGTASVTLTIPAAFTSPSTFVCTATDNTNPDAVQVSNSSGSQIAFKGNPSDLIGYVCIGD